jgi:hypothetical protein
VRWHGIHSIPMTLGSRQQRILSLGFKLRPGKRLRRIVAQSCRMLHKIRWAATVLYAVKV